MEVTQPRAERWCKNIRIVIYTFINPEMHLTHLSKLSKKERNMVKDFGKQLENPRVISIFIPKSMNNW